MKIYDSIIDTIGNTPLIKLKRLGKEFPVDIFLKLEFFNPFGSVKDRIGRSMIEAAERDGQLKKGMTIIEPTSGNTGIALASICAAKGYPCILVMPETMSQERRTLLLLFGAELVLTPASFGMRGAIAKAQELLEKNSNYVMVRQFENPANPKVHRETTALEIWSDTDGKVDIVISGVGTGGTFTGVGEVLKKKKPSVEMIAVEPFESSVLSGEKPGPHLIQGLAAGFIPKNMNTKLIDEIERVTGLEAIAAARRLIKEEGIPVGISSGAAMVAALRQAAKAENKGKTIVVLIPSSTERYLSTKLAEEERLRASQLVPQDVDEKYLAGVPVGSGI